jgi:predicted metal-dependent peptidase
MMKHLTPAVRIQKARTALLLDHPFFGSLLFRLGGRASNSIQTMATDGVSLFYNPAFVDTLNVAELAGVLAHEVMHPALQHHTRRGDRDRKRWNMACDYAINPLLLDAGLTLPKDVLIERRFRGMSAERTYNLIEEQGTAQDPSEQSASGQPSKAGGSGSQLRPRSGQAKSEPNAPVTPAAMARCSPLLIPKETTATPWQNRRGNGR